MHSVFVNKYPKIKKNKNQATEWDELQTGAFWEQKGSLPCMHS